MKIDVAFGVDVQVNSTKHNRIYNTINRTISVLRSWQTLRYTCGCPATRSIFFLDLKFIVVFV